MARTRNPNKPKRGLFNGYKTYDPHTGYGDASQWMQAFKYRMGIDAARQAVGADAPRVILGVDFSATWDDIKRAYYKLVRMYHPDLNPTLDGVPNDGAKFRKVQGAYELLELEFGK